MSGVGEREVGDWRTEAVAVLADISPHVTEASLSCTLESSASCIFFNVETLEERRVTVRLSTAGFCVVGDGKFDCEDNEHGDTFETVYSLLQSISPLYVRSFAAQLSHQLQQELERSTHN